VTASAHDLIAIGFTQRGDDLLGPAGSGVNLLAPAGASVCFTPLDSSRCYRLTISLPNGNTVSLVTAAVAIRIKEETR
jgi:hypothetical protein